MSAAPDDFRAGIVSILSIKGETPVGTGFFVSNQLVLTCAHVVLSAGATKGANVRFKVLATGQELSALVEPAYWRDSKEEDFAVLRLQEDILPGVKILKLRRETNTKGHTFETYGFPRKHPTGLEGNGQMGGVIPRSNGVSLIQLTSGQVVRGFSGAPVFDTQFQRVVGMVSEKVVPDLDEIKNSDKKLTIQMGLVDSALATPSSVIFKIYPELESQQICPYKGLAVFTEADSLYFCGRTRFIKYLIECLRRDSRCLVLVGASGSGKSSIVRAGLFPAFQYAKQIDSLPKDPPIFKLRPSQVSMLEEPLPRGFLMSSAFKEDSAALWQKIWDYTRQQPCRSIVFVDQFEEVFNLPLDEQQVIIRGLIEVLAENFSVTLILTLRSDFFALLQSSDLFPYLENGLVFIKGLSEVSATSPFETSPAGLSEEDLELMIIQPAEKVGMDVQESLVREIIRDLSETSNPLPLLEFTLEKLWQWEIENDSDRLTLNCYKNNLKGVQGAIRTKVDEVIASVDVGEAVVRDLFTRLVQYGAIDLSNKAQSRFVRRRRTRTELNPDDNPVINQLVEELSGSEARLLVTDGNTVEIIHDALITSEWSQIQKWIQEDLEFWLWRQRLEEDVTLWNSCKTKQHKEATLLSDTRLSIAESYLSKHQNALNRLEREYIEASLEKREELISDKKKARRRAVITLISAAIMLVIAGGLAWQESEKRKYAEIIGSIADATVKLDSIPRNNLISAAEFLLDDTRKLEQAESEDDTARALSRYRGVISLMIRLKEQVIQTDCNSSSLKNRDEIDRTFCKAEDKLVKLIAERRLPVLKQQLEQFTKYPHGGVRISERLPELEKQFAPGPLQTTYTILRRDFGAKADVYDKGELTTEAEARRMPCKTLWDIEILWRKYTGERCGWYSKSGKSENRTYDDPDCKELATGNQAGKTLAATVFEDSSSNSVERLNSCKISTIKLDP